MELNYQVIRSDRKTVALQIRPDGTVLVRCPRRMPEREVQAFVKSKEQWLHKHLSSMAKQPSQPPFTQREVEELARKALAIIPPMVARYAPLVGVSYGRVTIRNQRTRWGSCSGKGNLNFNCLLALVPKEVAEYVVVHELCHRREMNHSSRFWAEVSRVMPEYQEHRAWLKAHGGSLIARLP